MRSPNRRPSGRNSRFALFLLLTCFTDDRITHSRFGMETFGPPRRFSAWLRWSCRCAQLHQNGRHHSANLCQGQNRSPMLPGPVDPDEQGTSEHQLVVRACHNLRPAFRLLWSAQTWPIPQQDLLVQWVAMLEAQYRNRYVGQISARGAGSFSWPFQTNQLILGSRRRSLAPCRITRITLTSTHRAVRRCNWFQQ